MKKLIIFVLAVCVYKTAFAQPEKNKPADIYVKAISKYFNVDENELTKLWARGFGRNELIKIILSSIKSGKEINEIVKDRDKNGLKYFYIAEKYKFDFNSLLIEAAEIRKKIDNDINISTQTKNGSLK